MRTTIRFRRGRSVVASTTVPGPILPLDLPAGITHQSRRLADLLEVTLEPAEGLVAAHDVCGRVPIPHVVSGRIGFSYLRVPPPTPWRWGDIRSMWEASQRLDRWRRLGSAAAPWGQAQREQRHGVIDWGVLDRTLDVSRRLLARWPLADISVEGVLPLEVAGGLEDGPATERQLGSPAVPLATTGSGKVLPSVTIRSFGSVEGRRSSSVAAAAHELQKELRHQYRRWSGSQIAAEDRATYSAISGLLGNVATQARPVARRPDPPVSAWPPLFRSFYGTAMATLSQLRTLGAGSDWLPLSPVWQLYEDWLAERVLSIVSRVIGAPPDSQEIRGHRLVCRWSVQNHIVEVHVQPTLPTAGSYALAGREFYAVVSPLRPDVAVAASETGTRARVLVIDAKDWGELNPSAFTSEVSKYLWGIREVFTPTQKSRPNRVPAVEGVVLVSPLGGPTSAHLPLGKARTITAAPHGNPTQPVPAQELTATLVRHWFAYLGVPLP